LANPERYSVKEAVIALVLLSYTVRNVISFDYIFHDALGKYSPQIALYKCVVVWALYGEYNGIDFSERSKENLVESGQVIRNTVSLSGSPLQSDWMTPIDENGRSPNSIVSSGPFTKLSFSWSMGNPRGPHENVWIKCKTKMWSSFIVSWTSNPRNFDSTDTIIVLLFWLDELQKNSSVKSKIIIEMEWRGDSFAIFQGQKDIIIVEVKYNLGALVNRKQVTNILSCEAFKRASFQW
jgi:hypothetical protein